MAAGPAKGVLEFVREEDYVEYFLFPPKVSEIENNESEENELNKLLVEIGSLVKTFCQEYIWHKDEFRVVTRLRGSHLLAVDREEHEILPGHLHGISHFGDNIQDEWFIVSLLYELTRKIPGLIVRVEDGDGEFLLIEAANFLPDWANPDKCSGKVYIMNGKLHLIDLNREMTISEAINELSNNSKRFQVSPEIEKCIQERIKEFPENIKSLHHRANVYVPINVARLLKQRPSFIAASVQAFCNRDPIDLKVIRAMKFFPPENRVYTKVLFTKCLYAMLLHQNYNPDRRTGWQMPPKTHPDLPEHSLGMKLACGFEILVSEAQKGNHSFDETDKLWIKYLRSLKEKGYFKELLEGSQEYNKLKDSAKEYFLQNEANLKWNSSIGQTILEDLKSENWSEDDFTRNKSDLGPSDDDSWLEITAADLDKMLNDRYNHNLDDLDLEMGDDGENLTKKLQDFLKLKSDFEGIEPSSNSNPKNGDSNSIEKSNPNQIDFDPDLFQSHVKNLLDFVVPEDNWHSEDSGELSDYDEDDDDRNNIDKNMSKIRLKAYMDAMDKELKDTTIGQSFQQSAQQGEFDDIEDFQPVNIQENTLRNMVESYQSQLGGPGPASNLLNSMGLKVKPNQPKHTDV